MSATKTKNVKMYRGILGKDAVTQYSATTVEQAKESGAGLIVINQMGQESVVPNKKIRIVHRPDFTGIFSSVHERAGEGKYIASEAWQDDKTVVGAQHVIPYLAHEYCYASIVQAFQKSIGLSNLKDLKAVVKRSRDDGEFLVWQGTRTMDDCVVASPWFSKDEFWELACKLNSSLLSHLRKVVSGKKNVKQHMSPKKKFLDNINVMRRARRFHNPATGETEYKGGTYPYGFPLEQAGFAIDYCYLTDGFVIETDAKGHKYVAETGDFYLRLVIGRSVPWVMNKRDWLGCDDDDRFAFKSEKVRQAVIAARKRLDKTKTAA